MWVRVSLAGERERERERFIQEGNRAPVSKATGIRVKDKLCAISLVDSPIIAGRLYGTPLLLQLTTRGSRARVAMHMSAHSAQFQTADITQPPAGACNGVFSDALRDRVAAPTLFIFCCAFAENRQRLERWPHANPPK